MRELEVEGAREATGDVDGRGERERERERGRERRERERFHYTHQMKQQQQQQLHMQQVDAVSTTMMMMAKFSPLSLLLLLLQTHSHRASLLLVGPELQKNPSDRATGKLRTQRKKPFTVTGFQISFKWGKIHRLDFLYPFKKLRNWVIFMVVVFLALKWVGYGGSFWMGFLPCLSVTDGPLLCPLHTGYSKKEGLGRDTQGGNPVIQMGETLKVCVCSG